LIGPDGPLRSGDRVLLPASAKLSQGIGVPTFAGGTGQPLADNDVLSAAEASAIQARVEAFNAIILDVARQSRSSLADVDGLLRQAAGPGFNIGGVTFTEDFITGGTFSLDGVHPLPLGYAVLANEFLRSINATYGADIPPVDLFPFMFGDDAVAIPAGGVGEFIFTSEAAEQLLGALRVDPGDSRGGGPRAPRGPKSGRRASDHPSLRPPGH
ncbi:MAG TPA: hypothetical protein VJG13_03835, partial [Thermoanaerobaculia bacterium]|nr:hypothetical protein [Thermoanaerobaculia bacterium]